MDEELISIVERLNNQMNKLVQIYAEQADVVKELTGALLAHQNTIDALAQALATQGEINRELESRIGKLESFVHN